MFSTKDGDYSFYMGKICMTEKAFNLADLESRVVRYRDLRPCLNAFIDTRTPGSERKENFTIIGPGVSENPDQYVHIAEPHGFNIGGARQPPLCVNSQHSHDTAEIFVVHSGAWRFDFGETGQDASLEAGPGDVVSFPVNMFRGFTNIGDGPAFLWSVLGGDDPGRVTWAPRVFELARDYGLMLLENGALIDTAAGETPPPGIGPMPVTTRERIKAMRVMTQDDEPEVLVRASALPATGETLVIGEGGVLPAVEGFTLSRLILAPGASKQAAAEVLFVQDGHLDIRAGEARLTLDPGDTITIPADMPVEYGSGQGATLFIVRRV